MSLALSPAQAAPITNSIDAILNTLQVALAAPASYSRSQLSSARLAVAHYTALRQSVVGLVTTGPSMQYVVQYGDTILTIAHDLLGDATQYRSIMQTNSLTSSDVVPGQRLSIPWVTSNT